MADNLILLSKDFSLKQNFVLKQLYEMWPSMLWANFIELLKQKNAVARKKARLVYTYCWPKFHAIYIACDWYLAVVYLA